MHSLSAIKDACVQALDDQGTALGQFYAVVDPGSVMEMAAIIETLLLHIEQTSRGGELVEQVKARIAGEYPETDNGKPVRSKFYNVLTIIIALYAAIRPKHRKRSRPLHCRPKEPLCAPPLFRSSLSQMAYYRSHLFLCAGGIHRAEIGLLGAVPPVAAVNKTSRLDCSIVSKQAQ
jgi:hypothetical protein